MAKESTKRLVPRRRHKNVIEAPIPSSIVGEVLEQIELKLRFIWRITFLLEFIAGLYIIYWFATTHAVSPGVRVYGTLLTGIYCIVLVFSKLQRTSPSKLSSIFSLLWLAAACTPVAYHGRPEIPIVIAGILYVAHSLLGDRSLSRQASIGYVLLLILWLAANWGLPSRSTSDTDTLTFTLLLTGIAATAIIVGLRVARIQSARIFGDSIKGLEGMQQALAELHNKRVAEARSAETGRDGKPVPRDDANE